MDTRIYIHILLLLVMLVGCADMPVANQPQSAPASGSVTLLDENGNRALLETDSDNQSLIQIYSEQGWGEAIIDLPNATYPNQITLRFHLSGLEQLVIEHNGNAHEISISSSGDFAVHQSLTNAAGTSELDPTAPEWALAGLVEINGVPAQYINVTLPPSFVEQQIRSFTIQWVDFYR